MNKFEFVSLIYINQKGNKRVIKAGGEQLKEAFIKAYEKSWTLLAVEEEDEEEDERFNVPHQGPNLDFMIEDICAHLGPESSWEYLRGIV